MIFLLNKFMSIFSNITIPYIKEKWRHAGFQRYFRNIGWSLAGKVFSLVISFFIGALVARYLGPQRYGVLNYALSFVTLFVFLSSFGIDNVLIRELIKYKDQETSILNMAFTLKLLGGGLIIVTATLFSIFFENDSYTTTLIFIYSLHLIFISLNITDAYFQSIVKLKYSFIAQFTSTILVSILKLYFVFLGFGTGWFILALVFEAMISSIIMLNFFFRNGNSLKISLNTTLAKKLLADSWPFILTSAFYLIYTKIDQVMIGKMIDTTSLGIYSAGVKIAELWCFIPSIICGVMFPAIMNSRLINKSLYSQRLKRIFFLVIGLSLFFAFFQLILAKYFILFIFGQAYLDSTIILKIYTWAGVVVSAIIVLQQYLIIENKTKLIMVSSLVGAIMNVVLNLIFIPRFGIVGSAWATVISYSMIPIVIFITLRINIAKKNI